MKAFAPLAPEFYCSNFDKSLSFYTEDLGFEILYLTVKEGFAYLDRQGAQIMIEEPKEDSDWLIERPTYPFGRGVNFKMYTHNALELYESLKNKGYSFVRSLKDDWYPKDDIYVGNRQFIIQDPDGYLLRFAEDLGTKTTDEAHTIEISK
jgi:catechol 2,3-dioxygenase-like lactoylglutathione lyase family enzyme